MIEKKSVASNREPQLLLTVVTVKPVPQFRRELNLGAFRQTTAPT